MWIRYTHYKVTCKSVITMIYSVKQNKNVKKDFWSVLYMFLGGSYFSKRWNARKKKFAKKMFWIIRTVHQQCPALPFGIWFLDEICRHPALSEHNQESKHALLLTAGPKMWVFDGGAERVPLPGPRRYATRDWSRLLLVNGIRSTHLIATNFSCIFERMGRSEIGPKSFTSLSLEHFGIDFMWASVKHDGAIPQSKLWRSREEHMIKINQVRNKYFLVLGFFV